MTDTPHSNSAKRCLSIPETAKAANVGRSLVYAEIGRGALPTVKIGRRRLVPVEAFETWLASKYWSRA